MIEEIEQRWEQMVSSARTVTFPSAVSPRNTCSRCAAGPGDPASRSAPTAPSGEPACCAADPSPHASPAPLPTRSSARPGGAAPRSSSTRCRPCSARTTTFGFRTRRPDRRRGVSGGCRICGLGRTGQVMEALIPAVLEQRVQGKDAFRAWRLLVTKFGTPAPGPAPDRMRVLPPAEVWRRIPSWEFHRANVDPGRARTIVGCAQRADVIGAAYVVAGREGPRGADVAAGRRDLDGGRDRATGVRRSRRAVGGRLSRLQMGRLDLAGASDRRRRDGRAPRADAAAPPPGGALLEVSGLAHEPRRGARLPVQDIRAL